MESFQSNDAVETENPRRSQNTTRLLYTVKNLLRLLELCIAVAAVGWSGTRLPFAFQISGDFIRRLSSVVSSHLFVFLLSNSIIAALFFTAARFSGECGSDGGNAADDSNVTSTETALSPPPAAAKSLSLDNNDRADNGNGDGDGDGVVYEDKEMISSQEANASECDRGSGSDSASGSGSDLDSDAVRVYRRTKSEKVRRRIPRRKKELRRAETVEKLRSGSEEEEMSDEEFQKAVEEFIEKHLKFRRQESLSLVVQNQREIVAN